MRFREYIKEKSNWPSLVSLCVGVVAFIASFFLKEIAYPIISGMFLMLAFEGFLSQMTHLDAIKRRLDEVKFQQQRGAEIKTIHKCRPIPDVIDDAREELFISGSHLATLINMTAQLQHRTGIRIRLLAFNYHNPDLMRAYADMRRKKSKPDPRDMVSNLDLQHHPNIEVRFIDSIMPVLFAACDMKTPRGYIRALHYFNRPASAEDPCIELTKEDGKWYDAYLAQIESVWERAVPYGPMAGASAWSSSSWTTF